MTTTTGTDRFQAKHALLRTAPPCARWAWRPLLLVLIAAGLTRMGCDQCRAENIAEHARHSYLQAERDALIYKIDAPLLQQETRQFLLENGVNLPSPELPIDQTVLTDWNGTASNRTRMSIRLIRVEPREFLVQIHQIRERVNMDQVRETDRTRMTDMEWELFQRLQPKAAAAAQQEGQRRSQKAYERQLRWGCGSCGGCSGW